MGQICIRRKNSYMLVGLRFNGLMFSRSRTWNFTTCMTQWFKAYSVTSYSTSYLVGLFYILITCKEIHRSLSKQFGVKIVGGVWTGTTRRFNQRLRFSWRWNSSVMVEMFLQQLKEEERNNVSWSEHSVIIQRSRSRRNFQSLSRVTWRCVTGRIRGTDFRFLERLYLYAFVYILLLNCV